MTFNEFRAEVHRLAAGRYCTVCFESTRQSDDYERHRWRAYTEGGGWTQNHASPELVIAELEGKLQSDPLIVETSEKDGER